MENYLKFEDLTFKSHPNGNGLQAVLFFNNGYGISVIRYKTLNGTYGSYTSNEEEWEISVLIGNSAEYYLCYDTPITTDVVGHLTNDEVTNIMIQIQDLDTE